MYREHDLVLRTIRDYFTPDIDEIYIDNEEVFLRARDFLRDVMPGKEDVLRSTAASSRSSRHFNVESQIETILQTPRRRCKSGGGIVIDGTEALTAIDVNSGVRSAAPTRRRPPSAPTSKRRPRSRASCGCATSAASSSSTSSTCASPQHIQEVEKTPARRDAPDKARHELGRISQFGLLEISRQRLRPGGHARPPTRRVRCARGTGRCGPPNRRRWSRCARSTTASRRATSPACARRCRRKWRSTCSTRSAKSLAQLERRYDSRLLVELKDGLMPHQIELEIRERAPVPLAVPVAHGGVAAADAPQPAAGGNGAAATAEAASGKKKRRRRGRRRGGGLRAAAAIGDALAALGGATPPPSQDESPEPPPAVIANGSVECPGRSSRPPRSPRQTTL